MKQARQAKTPKKLEYNPTFWGLFLWNPLRAKGFLEEVKKGICYNDHKIVINVQKK